MKLLLPSKALILLFLLVGSQVPVTAMQKPPSKFAETPHFNFFRVGEHAVLLGKLMSAESNVESGSNILETYAAFDADDLEEIIALLKVILQNPSYFQLASDTYTIGGVAFDKESYRKQLANGLRNAEAALAQRKGKPQVAPVQEKKAQEQPMHQAIQPQGITVAQRNLLKKFLEAEQKNDFNFYLKKSQHGLESVILIAQKMIQIPRELDELQRQTKIPKAKLVQILYNVISNAKKALAPSPGRQIKPELNITQKQANGPWPEYPDSPR